MSRQMRMLEYSYWVWHDTHSKPCLLKTTRAYSVSIKRKCLWRVYFIVITNTRL